MRANGLSPKAILLLSILLFVPAGYGLLFYGCWKDKLGVIVAGIVVLVLAFLAATSGKIFQQVLIKKIGELKEISMKGAIFVEGGPEDEYPADESSVPIDSNDVLKGVQSKLGVSAEQAKTMIDKAISVLSEGVTLEEPEMNSNTMEVEDHEQS